MKTVILIDNNLFYTALGAEIVQNLKDAFSESGQVKLSSKELPIPYSIQWIIPKRNKDGERIENHWKTVSHTLVFESAANLTEMLKKSNSPQALINQLFGEGSESLFEKHRIRLLVHEENLDGMGKKPRTKMSADERHLVNELKRMHGARNFETIVGCEILYGIDFVFVGPSAGDINECCLQVIRSTKSVLDCLATIHPPSMFTSEDGKITWYPPPPKKIGSTVAVAKNSGNLGLHLLWQKSLMQISKGMGIEQAKIITSQSDFASPSTAIQTFIRANTDKEGEKLLTAIQVRPNASAKDFMSLSARSNVGADVSRKVYRMMTAEDGDIYI